MGKANMKAFIKKYIILAAAASVASAVNDGYAFAGA